jgi:hypothetical protein
MTHSIQARVAVSILVVALAFALASGYVGQVNAWMMHRHHNNVFFIPFFYYYPYYSYYGSSFYGTNNCGYGGYGGYGNSGYGGYGGYGNSGYGGYGGYGNSGYGGSGCLTKYQLTVNADPSSLSGQLTGGGSYNSGSTASFSVGQSIVQASPDTRYVFAGWKGGYSGTGTSGSVTMNSATTVTAAYQTQYLLTLSDQPSGTPSPQGAGWFNAGDTASISVPSQILVRTLVHS